MGSVCKMKNSLVKYYLFFGILINLIFLTNLFVVDNYMKVLFVNLGIIVTYSFHLPRDIFNPRNIVFAFSFLYITLPSSIQYLYEFFNIDYILPWGQATDWFDYQLITYFDMYMIFLVFFYSFLFFESKKLDFNYKSLYKNLSVNKKYFFLLYICTFFVAMLFLQLSGGIEQWILNYKEAFLTKREGLGSLNFLSLFLVNVVVFILGLLHFKAEKYKVLMLIHSLLFIVLMSFLQGFKSRIIILLVIFYFPYLMNLKLKFINIVLLGSLFFTLLFIGNYVRSNGYYGSVDIFIEYMMTYFNIYHLHDIFVKSHEAGFFTTVHYPFVKPLIALGFLDPSAAYDLSVELTKEYFPKDWEMMRSTQQWPLATDLFLNYFGFFLGWFPIIVYTYIVSKIYTKVKQGDVALSLIFILEFFRTFTVMRGMLIPWQMPVYLLLYAFVYLIINLIVKKDHLKCSKNYLIVNIGQF